LVDIILSALSTTVEILASKLGNPDGEIEGVVVVLNVGDESVGANIVPMNSKTIESASCACLHESLGPSHTVGVTGAGWANELVTLALQRLDILLPKAGGSVWVNVGLTGLIRLVKAEDSVGITLNDESLEV